MRFEKQPAALPAEETLDPGNWDEMPDQPRPALPATRFTAARFLAYRASQKNRKALPDETEVEQ